VELARLRKQEVEVYLPKFKITWGVFKLNDILIAMGMKDAFFLPPANFSGLTGKKDLYISHVLHKAFVEVNEEGTEAAAATAVVIAKESVAAPPPVFRADRPFVFMIRDNRSGTILFMGKISNPAIKVE
jgi:serpin B